MSGFIFFWIAIALLVVVAAAALLRKKPGKQKTKSEADPEDNYPLW